MWHLAAKLPHGDPARIQGACGHPGAHVRVRKVPVTIRHADCNLIGVAITYRGYGGATVSRGSISVGTSSGFTLTIHHGTLDVTVNATGPAGQRVGTRGVSRTA
jgi:hypothetical protein